MDSQQGGHPLAWGLDRGVTTHHHKRNIRLQNVAQGLGQLS